MLRNCILFLLTLQLWACASYEVRGKRIESCRHVVDDCPVAGGVTWNCKKRFVYGVNYAWHNYSADFGGIPDWNRLGVAATAAEVDKELADMKAHGASVVRWWVMPDLSSAAVVFDSGDSPAGLGGTFEADLLKAIELAEKNDLYLMLTIFSFEALKPRYSSGNVTVRSLQPLIVDGGKRRALLENVIRPMAKIVEKSPYKKRVMTWDLFNEPEWAITGPSKYGDPDYECLPELQCVSHDQMESFLADMAAVLRVENRALLSVGGAAMKWKSGWTLLDIDYYQFHMYDWVNESYPYSKSPSDWQLTDKPVVIGEFPFQGLTGIDATKLLSSWYGNGYAGALGWGVTDRSFAWLTARADIKNFAERNSCQLRY